MSFDLVEKPIPGPEAFEQTSDAALLSQAAILLAVGAQMRGKAEHIPDGEFAMLAVPRVGGLEVKEARFDPTDVRGGVWCGS